MAGNTAIPTTALPAASPFATPQSMQAAQRSQYLAAALQSLQQSAAAGIRTPTALGSNLLAEALLQVNKRHQDKAVIEQQLAQRQAMGQAAGTAFPGDPTAALAFQLNPTAALETYMKRYDPMAVRGGDTILNGSPGAPSIAPVLGVDGGQPYMHSAQGTTWGASRAPSVAEQSTVAAQGETHRHNLAEEDIGRQEIPVKQAQAAAALQSAATGAGNLQLNTDKSPTVTVPQGFQIVTGGR